MNYGFENCQTNNLSKTKANKNMTKKFIVQTINVIEKKKNF